MWVITSLCSTPNAYLPTASIVFSATTISVNSVLRIITLSTSDVSVDALISSSTKPSFQQWIIWIWEYVHLALISVFGARTIRPVSSVPVEMYTWMDLDVSIKALLTLVSLEICLASHLTLLRSWVLSMLLPVPVLLLSVQLGLPMESWALDKPYICFKGPPTTILKWFISWALSALFVTSMIQTKPLLLNRLHLLLRFPHVFSKKLVPLMLHSFKQTSLFLLWSFSSSQFT